MEASTVAIPEAPPEPERVHDGAAEATRSTEELFQWSGYVHVGVGAEECEHAADGNCELPLTARPEGGVEGHFHAWVCLANPFQMRDIGDKARAARARKTRALREAGDERHSPSDAYVTLEGELDELRRDRWEELLDGIARSNVDKQLQEIVEELKDDERFEHQAEDAEEFRRLSALPEDQRDEAEYEQLQAEMLAYGEQFSAIVEKRVGAETERLRARSEDEVVEIERRARIDAIATEAYLHTYYTWAIFIGTREPTTTGFPSARKFEKPEDLKNTAPEVVQALREKIKVLEERTVMRGDAAGNF